MKHCPACNFSFPDFHIVCDFDGSELVQDPQRLALIKLPARKSFIRQFMTSPKTLTALAILGLFCVAAFIAYQQMTSRSSRTLLAVNVATPAPETPAAVRVVERRKPSTLASKSGNPRRRSMSLQHSSSVSSSVVRNRHEKRNDQLPGEAELARRSEQQPPKKQPKVVAMLKTTWRVLKRPFSF